MTDALPAASPPPPEKSLVRQNAEADPSYAPYCMRCSGISRMQKVEPFLWKHHCGAVHDERTPSAPVSSPDEPRDREPCTVTGRHIYANGKCNFCDIADLRAPDEGLSKALDRFAEQIALGEESYDDPEEYNAWKRRREAAEADVVALYNRQREERQEYIDELNERIKVQDAELWNRLGIIERLKAERLTPEEAQMAEGIIHGTLRYSISTSVLASLSTKLRSLSQPPEQK